MTKADEEPEWLVLQVSPNPSHGLHLALVPLEEMGTLSHNKMLPGNPGPLVTVEVRFVGPHRKYQ